MVLLFPDILTEIDIASQNVVIDGVEQKVRPKTFQLLQVLIEADGELVSKDHLLNTVWDDVVVDEQVIFQSVKELRKLFPGQTVIKTVPRKGYVWLPKAQLPAADAVETTNPNTPDPFKRYLTFGVVALFLIGLLVTVLLRDETQPSLVEGSIVVLPVQSDIPVNDHDWVRYGIMDQVISRLESSAQAGVLQTDYVMDVMARAKVTMEDISQGRVDAIFDVSGAELILSMGLTGNPNDYQIIYTLYQRDGIEKGVVLDDSVQDAADQVAVIVGNRITPNFTLSQGAYESSFADRLIAEALEAKRVGDRQGAQKLLEAALVSVPDNLAAARLLTQTLVESGAEVNAVRTVAEPALTIARRHGETIDQIRLLFWLGLSESSQGNHEVGMALFDQAKTQATAVNDWLYLAYIEEIRGQIQQAQQNYAQANAHFQQAMNYHGILHCPLGKSNNLINLSKLAMAQQNQSLAVEHAEQALELIESRRLSTKLPIAQQWRQQLDSKPAPSGQQE